MQNDLFLITCIILGILIIFIIFSTIFSGRRGEFFGVFGFMPKKKKNRIGEQQVIDRVLKKRAEEFFLLANQETKMLDYTKKRRGIDKDMDILVVLANRMIDFSWDDGSKTISLYTIVSEIKYGSIDEFVSSLKKEVKKSKSRFWYAHALAKRFDYNVRERCSDYTM